MFKINNNNNNNDVVVRHNHLHDVVVDFCRRAHLSVSIEKGHGLTRDHSHSRPADVLIAGWDRGNLQHLMSR